ncbi:hypothetical protein [Frigoriglobus tundricola]|uniref:Uncharacterized protein n=1 Tax=Frigoriglobus tundricola TaxID=2774151 RepID=A0A6M5YL86_9BACT|nr:hypothetical protein [Frigoriglobus tundricola]QJW94053.1 hypothetical protein FTUN_1572 [Frigoriglobus tundricola]
MTTVRFLLPAVALGLALFTGCSGSSERAGPGPDPAAPLREVGDLLRAAAPVPGRGPAKLADLTRLEPVYPQAYQAVKSGEVVVVWGAAMKGEGEVGKGGGEVIAHQKAVPTEGGHVLLNTGEVKQMTADEFKAAPKAK